MVVGRAFVHVKALAFRPAGVMMLIKRRLATGNIHGTMHCMSATGTRIDD
jgi:hypothetical protein